MKIFEKFFLLILFSALAMSVASADGTIYLVRHAEKQDDGTDDPHLNELGVKRAEYLAQHLSLADITKIYSSNYQRTQETAEPLSVSLGVAVQSYDPSNLEAFAARLKAEEGNAVVVGHSNTTPALAALLSGEVVDAIEEDEYENLYQVVLINEKTRLTRFKIFPIGSTSVNLP